MVHRLYDWKDVANGFFDKALSLAVLLMLFTFLVFPEIKVKEFEMAEVTETESVEIPPEIREKIQPPTRQQKPQVNIVMDDEFEGEDDEDIEIIDTIEKTSLDPLEEVAPPPTAGTTSKFAVFEDPPVPIKTVRPKYPVFQKKAGIEGTVYLQVEVLADGSVGAVEIMKSLDADMDKAAIDAVKQFKFQPAKSGGNPVPVWINLPIQFSLD